MILIHKVVRAQDLDSSFAEFILSNAEGLFRNDMGCIEIVAWVVVGPLSGL